jgi:hypothetical protein
MKWAIKKIACIFIIAVISTAAKSKVIYIDLNISQPNIEDCFTGIMINSLNKKLEVFPNPTEGLFKISLNNSELSGKLKVAIQNIQGQVIYSDEFELQENSLKKEIDLSGYSSGIYVLNIVAERWNCNTKIIIK